MATATDNSRVLVAYDQIRDPMAFVREMGESIAKSQMFGCETVEQGRVLAMTCLAKRIDPLSLVERYHLIQGDLSMRSDAMLAGLHDRGGKHRIIQRDSTAAEIEITVGDQTHRFRLTWEEAQQEEFTKDKKGEIKKNYATPRSRMQMLWARVVSDGIRAMDPGVVCGSYTPEEIHDYKGIEHSVGPAAVDAEYEVKAEQKSETVAEVDGFATGAQCTRILDLYVKLGVPHEAQQAALTKRGVKALRSLTADQANEMITKLEAKAAESEKSRVDPSATSVQINTDPCTQTQIDRVKELISQVSQTGIPDIGEKIKSRLVSQGLQKIIDLTVSECDSLIRSLELKNLEAWAASALKGHGRSPVGQPPF